MTSQQTCLAGFFFILACIGRRSVAIGLAGRPLFWSLVWGSITGAWFPVLFLAVFLEVFWLDLFHIGNRIPPFAALPFFVFLALYPIIIPPLPDWSILAFITALVLVMPLAYLYAALERAGWFFAIRAHEKLVAIKDGYSPPGGIAARSVWASILLETGCALALAAFSCIFYYLVFTLAVHTMPPDFMCMGFIPTGPALRIIAKDSIFPTPLVYWLVPVALGGLISLRIASVRLVFAATTMLLLIAGATGMDRFFW